MRAIKQFEQFMEEGVVKRQKPDKSRAKFLVKEAEKTYSFLQELKDKIGITEDNANSLVKMCYDVIMELIRAKMLLEGFNTSGVGAHEAEVSYLRVLKFNDREVQLVDQIRYFRNGILYYGTILDKEYAELVFSFLNKTYPKLKDMVKKNS